VVKGVDAGGNLRDGELVRGGVVLFDDAADRTIRGADDSAVPGWIVEDAGQQGCRGVLVRVQGEERGQRFRLQQGSVARQDDDGADSIGRHRLECEADGMAGSVLFSLDDGRRGGRDLAQLCADLVAPVPDHDDGVCRAQGLRGCQHMAQQ